MPDDRFYRPEVQTLPREQIAALQLERLQALSRASGSGRSRSSAASSRRRGLTPRDIRSLDDLRAIPTTVKDDLRASEAEHPPLGDYRGSTLDDCVRIGCSTGTSGKPTLIFWTRHDQAVDLEAVCRGRWRWGLRPGSSLAHGHPFGLYGGGISFSKGIEALGLLNVPCAPPSASAVDAARWCGCCRWCRPEHYRFFGNAGAQYADAARAAGYDPERDLNLHVQGEDPQGAVQVGERRPRGARHARHRLRRGRRRARRRGSRHRRGDRPRHRQARRPRRARQPGGHRARRRTTPSCATTCRTCVRRQPEAVPVRRDAQAPLLRGAREGHRRRSAAARSCPSTCCWRCSTARR